MKKMLLSTLSVFILLLTQAQKNKILAYAITGVEKGNTTWTEVRLVDITTGEEMQTIYKSAADAQILNARTGKPVMKRDAITSNTETAQGQATPAPVATIIRKDGNSI